MTSYAGSGEDPDFLAPKTTPNFSAKEETIGALVRGFLTIFYPPVSE